MIALAADHPCTILRKTKATALLSIYRRLTPTVSARSTAEALLNIYYKAGFLICNAQYDKTQTHVQK